MGSETHDNTELPVSRAERKNACMRARRGQCVLVISLWKSTPIPIPELFLLLPRVAIELVM